MVKHDELVKMIEGVTALIELSHSEKGRLPDSALKHSQAALNVAHAISVLRNLDK